MSRGRAWLALVAAGGLALGTAGVFGPRPAGAQTPLEAALRARLEAWAAAVAAGDAAGSCDLFAADLRSYVQGAPPAGRDEVCGRIARAIARSDARLLYTPEIEEVIDFGDGRAAAILRWRLEAEVHGAVVETALEQGLDLFRRDPDGAWRIFRFTAYPMEPG